MIVVTGVTTPLQFDPDSRIKIVIDTPHEAVLRRTRRLS